MFGDALAYPIRRAGWLMIVIGAVFSVILDLMQHAPLFGIAVAIFGAGYFGSFYLDIVSTTMIGRDEVPEWPSFSNFLDDIVVPFLRLCALFLISFWPIVAVVALAPGEAEWMPAGVVVAVVFGCLYFPMAVLAAQAFGSVSAALPHVVVPGIFRAMPGYLLGVIGLIAVFFVSGFVEGFTSKIPFVGWFVSAAVALYGLMFQARLIGLIYRREREALGWE